MNKFSLVIVFICTVGILQVAAQNGTVELKNAQGQSVGSARLSAAKEGGVSVAI